MYDIFRFFKPTDFIYEYIWMLDFLWKTFLLKTYCNIFCFIYNINKIVFKVSTDTYIDINKIILPYFSRLKFPNLSVDFRTIFNKWFIQHYFQLYIWYILQSSVNICIFSGFFLHWFSLSDFCMNTRNFLCPRETIHKRNGNFSHAYALQFLVLYNLFLCASLPSYYE